MSTNQENQGKLLAGKIAVVTGAGQGIGEAIIMQFAKNGANVVIADINIDNANKVAKKAQEFGVEGFAIKMDVSNVNDIKEKVKQIQNHFGGIDIWVNNAGIGQDKPIEEISEADWDKLLDVNLKGVFFCSQAVFAIMKIQKKGKIINIASMAGERGGRVSGAHYSASKAGVIVLTKVFGASGGQYNINVNAIAPGLILTQMASDLGWDKQEHNDIPLKRLGTTEDVGKVALFLASEMSDYVSGDTVDVNGGMFMR